MTTLFPALLMTGLALAAAPILLHLLNLQQRRPVKWAAMEFLLESRARNRTWINLKQWLLLAARVLAIVLAGLMAARPSLTGDLAAWFPGEPRHVTVLMDDSYSMTDRGGQASPWSQATAALSALATRVEETPRSRLTVIRTSQPSEPLKVPQNEIASLRNAIEGWQATEHAGGLAAGLESLMQTVGETKAGERTIAYVLSDFRRRDLRDADRTRLLVEQITERADAVTLSPCADRRHANLTITGLSVTPSAFVSGVELTGVLTLTNHSANDVGRTTVRLAKDGIALPAVEFAGIAAGDSATQRFPIRFTEPGPHRLTAELPQDAVAADNHRYLTLNLPAERPVLIVAGSGAADGGNEGRVFATALRPSQSAGAGWQPVRSTFETLATAGGFFDFAAVLLLDVPRLPNDAADALTRFVDQGGGVLMVLGEQVDRGFYNRRLLGGAGRPLLPIRLDVPTQTRADDQGRSPTLRVADHPALRVFTGERSRFADLIRVRQRHTLTDDTPTDGVRIAATLSTGAPLLLESVGGRGRVFCLMTTTARPPKRLAGWSNLSASPLFPVLVNELTAHVAALRLQPATNRVGDAWRSLVEANLPGANQLDQLIEGGEYVTLNTAGNQTDSATAAWGDAEQAGIYRMTAASGDATTVAVNVQAEEGDLTLLADRELRDLVQELDVPITPANQLIGKTNVDGVDLCQRLGLVLLGLLAIEQALAYACSYHASRGFAHAQPAGGDA